MKKTLAQRKYKDSTFRSLFKNKRRLLELYNAIDGTSYTDPRQIELNTLASSIFCGVRNDISFKIAGKTVVLIEHQSSLNPNMPLRMAVYFFEILKGIVEGGKLHDSAPVKIPSPQFVVLYNGTDNYPAEGELKLSDAFEESGNNRRFMEAWVRIININKGCNPKLEDKSPSLAGYCTFVAKAREFERKLRQKGLEEKAARTEAVKKAVKYCMKRDILLDYLKKNSLEVVDMSSFFNCTLKNYKAICRREAQREAKMEALAEGRAEGTSQVAKAMKVAGETVSKIMDYTGLSRREIAAL